MHPKFNKYIWLVVVIQLLLSIVAFHKDADSLFDLVGLVIWCTWGTFILAFIFTKIDRSNKLLPAILGAFTLTSLLAIGFLAVTSFAVFSNGRLNESIIVFIIFPFGYIKFGIIGAVAGDLLFFAKGKLSKKSLKNDAL